MKTRRSVLLTLTAVVTAAAACHVYVGDEPPKAPPSATSPSTDAPAAPQTATPTRVVPLHVGGPDDAVAPGPAPTASSPPAATAPAATPASDSSVSLLCQIAATPCKTTAADCTTMLSGLSVQGKQAVAQCVARGCQGGLSTCVAALAPAHKAR